MDKDLVAVVGEENGTNMIIKKVVGINDTSNGVMVVPLERNILGKFDIQHVAEKMNPFSHNCFVIEKNIIVGFDFSELQKAIPGSEIFRVSKTSNQIHLTQLLI